MHKINATSSRILLFIMLIGLGWYANVWYGGHSPHSAKCIKQRGFQYISPLLDVELPEGYTVGREPIPFKHKVEKFVKQQLDSNAVRDVSVYYRDLSDGPWFGINENTLYNPASMMKVPVMIAWLKRAEKDPSILSRRFVFDEKADTNPPQSITGTHTLKGGGSYTVEELIRYMIQYSDNRAMSLLYFALPREEFAHVVDSMDVHNEVYGKYDSITVHGYSGFLRILYNASFLNRAMSEKALQTMGSSDFRDGLIAGVPKGIKVASKFGEYNTKEAPEDMQLHEFGIVYHPKGPYIVGVLTRGNDSTKQAGIIKAISAIIYDSVSMTVNNR